MREIAVVIHDAGAAQVLVSLIKANFDYANWHIFTPLNSPAHKITDSNGLKLQTSTVKEISPDLIFYGTSWQNDFHLDFLNYAKKHTIKTVAFLDNWENYRKRFNNIFPDFICVNDNLAYETAKYEGLTSLIKMKDYATINILNKRKNIKEQNTLLILSEPTARVAKNSYDDANYWGYTETSWMQDILDNFELFECSSLTIRLHPSDNPLMYENIMQSYKHINYTIEQKSELIDNLLLNYTIEQKSELIDNLLSSKIILGNNTVALYYAYLLNKLSISYIPSKNRTCNLPIAKRNQIQSFHQFKLSNFEKNSSNRVNEFGIDFKTLLERLS